MDDDRISQIEKYLGLDYSVDTKDSVIDYSFISIPSVKDLLECDNREMMRYRYGARYHKTNFNEFCRCAHLQSEMLLNYYYNQRNNSDLKLIKTHIQRFNPTVENLDKATSLSAISYGIKLWAFRNEYPTSNIYYTFDYLRRVRNELSHRSLEKDTFQIQEYQKELKALHIPIYPDGSINWFAINKDPVIKEIFDININKTPKYREYQYLLWYTANPYDEITDCLNKLSNIIKEALNKDNIDIQQI